MMAKKHGPYDYQPDYPHSSKIGSYDYINDKMIIIYKYILF